MIVVAQDGSGDFKTVQAAIDAVPANNQERVTILIKKGIYREKVMIDKPHITLIGEDRDQTIITYDDHAKKLLPNGEPYGTFRSYTIFFGADDLTAKQLTFANTAGRGELVGQALAAYVDGDRNSFYQCRLLGRQDTLFTGPLPAKPKQGTTFGSPRDGLPRKHSRQYYQDCYIEGDVDFIFGSATAVFNRCEIFALVRDSEDMPAHARKVHGYITAASTPADQPFGYVFMHCRLTSNAPAQSYYLGRPWRDHAKTVWISCWLGEHIIDAGWHNWNRPEAEQTTEYCEYQSIGPGRADEKRCNWSKILTDEEAKRFTIANILGGQDGWNPEV